ncbi:Hypothetical protein D9617_5g067530 [Elsinoe fawcettii]|nr:Hypothetical protein D9617_5g067530 [Elsinoe fawcettii]
MEDFLNDTNTSPALPNKYHATRPKTVKLDEDFVDTPNQDVDQDAPDRRKSTSGDISSERYCKGPVLRLFSTHTGGRPGPLHSRLTQLFRTKTATSSSDNQSDSDQGGRWVISNLSPAAQTRLHRNAHPPRRNRPSRVEDDAKSSAEDEGHTN